MEAAVPFALLASVEVVAFAAALGLVAAGFSTARTRTQRLLVVLGALLLAAAHSLTGAQLGADDLTALTYARAAGYLLVALGVSGLRLPTDVTTSAPLVVAPLAAAPTPATVAAAAALAAAVAAVRARRPGWLLLVGSFALAVPAELLAMAAHRRTAVAVALLVARGLSALALIGYLARLAETRLLSKVVAAIMAGVLALAVGTAIVVGSVATRSLSEDLSASIGRVARGQVSAVDGVVDTVQTLAIAFSVYCPSDPECGDTLSLLTADPAPFAVHVTKNGATVDPRHPGLTDLEAHAIAQSEPVREALRTGRLISTLDVLAAGRPKVVALGVSPTGGEATYRRVDEVFVYGSVLGQERVTSMKSQTDLDATVFAADAVAVSSLPAGSGTLDRVRQEYARRNVLDRLRAGARAVVVAPEGERPAIRFVPLADSGGRVAAVLAVSADAGTVLRTQRAVLRALFLGTLVVALLVGLLALSLGRRVVRPVQALTLAATRVRGGDLSVRTDVHAADELGVLARTFDTMTESLADSQAELMSAAQQEAALRARLQAVLNSIGEALITTSPSGLVTGANPAAQLLLLQPEEDLVGRSVHDVVTGQDPAGGPLLPGLAEGARTGMLDAGGRAVPVALGVTPLSTGDGHVLVLRDMTREREVERMKTEFLSNVSHELRTPLTPIRGYAEVLSRKSVPEQTVRSYAGTILEASLRMGRVVDLLVDVAALEAGRVVPAYERVQVADLVDGCLADWRRREPEREFRRRVATKLPPVLADRTWVGKALDELVHNAVKYSAGPVTLAAALADSGDAVRLTVRDTGAGIPEDTRPALFAAFEQGDGSATRTVGGLGLGLAFVSRVVDAFGLGVEVDSTVGKGSSFTLLLPLTQAVRFGPASAPAPAGEPGSGNGVARGTRARRPG